MTRPVALYDTECFLNYWLLKFWPIDGGLVFSFAIRDGASFSDEQRAMMAVLFDRFRTVSFNGDYYDVPMCRGALLGFNTNELKQLNDAIIVDQAKPWELGLGEWRPTDHVDLKPVCPGQGSQNAFAARVHHHTIEDFEIDFSKPLTPELMAVVASKCENDLGKLKALYDALKPQLRQRERIGQRYGINVMSKSDAQVGEAILRKRCEAATGRRIYAQKMHEIDWSYRFMYDVPAFISFTTPQLQRALELVRESVFRIQPPASFRPVADDEEDGRCILMPPQLKDLEIAIDQTVYAMGIGGLHSQEKRLVVVSNATHQVLMPDVTAYYPNLMVRAGAYPDALGPQFVPEYEGIKVDRETAKKLQKQLERDGLKGTPQHEDAQTDNEGGKIGINGPYGKTGSPFSILWAPKMLIQTTLTGQLSLLMLIEWLHLYGIPVVSANTDGLVVHCPRDKLPTYHALIQEWERRSGLNMETVAYRALYARDVNNYFAITDDGEVKRKGEYAKTSLKDKKAPDLEICADAAADYLTKGIPVEQTIRACRDIRKFVTVQKVAGGALKMWGEGPRKGQSVASMVPTLQAYGWQQPKRGQWVHASLPGRVFPAAEAHAMCYAPRRPEWIGVTVRWYYSTRAPGPIEYRSNGNTVGGSYGAMPANVLPATFPDDVDYAWYVDKAKRMLTDVGANLLTA